MADDTLVLQRETELSQADVVQLARNAFTSSWLDETERRAHLDRVDAWVAANA